MTTIPSISTEYVRVALTETTGAQLDSAVQMAFVPDGTEPFPTASKPAADDWRAAAWENDTPSSTRTARVLIGPDQAVTLAGGDYIVWYQLTDTPEIIARPAGRLTIT